MAHMVKHAAMIREFRTFMLNLNPFFWVVAISGELAAFTVLKSMPLES